MRKGPSAVQNEPPVDFTIPEKRKAYAQGIAAVRAAEG